MHRIISSALFAFMMLSARAESYRIEIDGNEIASGDTFELRLTPGADGGFTKWEIDEAGEYYDCYSDFYVTFTNISGERLRTSIERATIENAAGHSLQWCINNCYFSDYVTFPNNFSNNTSISMHCIFSIDSPAKTGESSWKFIVGEGTVKDPRSENPTAEIVDNERKCEFTLNVVYSDPSGVNALLEDVNPEYYNLQGIRIENPSAGEIYIVKRGKNVAKERFLPAH